MLIFWHKSQQKINKILNKISKTIMIVTNKRTNKNQKKMQILTKEYNKLIQKLWKKNYSMFSQANKNFKIVKLINQ